MCGVHPDLGSRPGYGAACQEREDRERDGEHRGGGPAERQLIVLVGYPRDACWVHRNSFVCDPDDVEARVGA